MYKQSKKWYACLHTHTHTHTKIPGSHRTGSHFPGALKPSSTQLPETIIIGSCWSQANAPAFMLPSEYSILTLLIFTLLFSGMWSSRTSPSGRKPETAWRGVRDCFLFYVEKTHSCEWIKLSEEVYFCSLASPHCVDLKPFQPSQFCRDISSEMFRWSVWIGCESIEGFISQSIMHVPHSGTCSLDIHIDRPMYSLSYSANIDRPPPFKNNVYVAIFWKM